MDEIAARDREPANEVVVGDRAREVGERWRRRDHGAKRRMRFEGMMHVRRLIKP